MKDTLTYTQVKSAIGSTKTVHATLTGLGLTKLYKTVTRKIPSERTISDRAHVLARRLMTADTVWTRIHVFALSVINDLIFADQVERKIFSLRMREI